MKRVDSSPGPSALARRVRISVDNPMVAEALSATAGRCGWSTTVNESGRHVLVADRVPVLPLRSHGTTCVVVCEPTPWAARGAMDSISSLLAASVVCADRPADLARALESIIEDAGSIPLRVMELAAQMPALTERQIQVLRGVIAGQSNAHLCEGLYVSIASVKRDPSDEPTRAAS